jgi:hypothetical protein
MKRFYSIRKARREKEKQGIAKNNPCSRYTTIPHTKKVRAHADPKKSL